jgi:hypothetical protein
MKLVAIFMINVVVEINTIWRWQGTITRTRELSFNSKLDSPYHFDDVSELKCSPSNAADAFM